MKIQVGDMVRLTNGTLGDIVMIVGTKAVVRWIHVVTPNNASGKGPDWVGRTRGSESTYGLAEVERLRELEIAALQGR